MNDKLSIKVIKQPLGSEYYANGMGWELNGKSMSAAILAIVAKHYFTINNINHVTVNGAEIETDNLFEDDIPSIPYLDDEEFDEEDSSDNAE
jgi:hypothetical protein